MKMIKVFLRWRQNAFSGALGAEAPIPHNFMSIDTFCWNVRGFNKTSHRNGLKKWLQLNQPLFGSLIETHVQQPKRKKYINALLPGWYFEDNYGFSELGKKYIIWHPSVQVTILSKSLQMISCEVKLPRYQFAFVVSFVYASNCEIERRMLWEELASFSADHRVVNKPWTVLGDFNQALNPEDHSLLERRRLDRGTSDFRSCLHEASLVDLTYRGSTYTWWNMSESNPGAKKIDRVLVNALWLDTWSMSFALFSEPDFWTIAQVVSF
ncbi:hypothetical protein V5N11_013282 [Cardamine amara subsp. amara]|uniref:Endonuclease/exonuclease/phosphatase domain-containing protein n=1 Tax=Cardamine amara subsp. amara TaxID=228776 RepID=A0ABD0ZE92_CARAN